MRKIHSSVKKVTLGAALLSLCLCNTGPTVPGSRNAGLCDKPTTVSDMAPDSTYTIGVLEIYDYEKRLVNYGVSKIPVATQYDIYWNGTDTKGNPVETGKYTAKISLISEAAASCTCMDIIVTSSNIHKADTVR